MAPWHMLTAMLVLMIWLPDVGGDPHLVDLDLLVGVDLDLGDFGEIAGVAEVEGDAQGGALGKLLLAVAPIRHLGHQLGDAGHAAGVEAAGSAAAAATASAAGGGGAGLVWASRSRRNCTGSLPAAWASSSMKD